MDVQSVAGHLLPPGSVFGSLSGQRDQLFPDLMFADLFASGRGRPSVPTPVVATVLVLQALETGSSVLTGHLPRARYRATRDAWLRRAAASENQRSSSPRDSRARTGRAGAPGTGSHNRTVPSSLALASGCRSPAGTAHTAITGPPWPSRTASSDLRRVRAHCARYTAGWARSIL